MRLIFAGTPEFAHVALDGLHQAGHEIALVLTQPDRPAGRGMRLQASPVKQFALAHGLPLAQPRGLRMNGKFADDAAAAQAAIDGAQAQAMVVAAYGLILPVSVLHAPALGCLNIHASLLPRWRGAAPIQRAIEAGDACSGVTIMQMDEGLDTGAMLLTESMPIEPHDSSGSLHERLAILGGRLMVQALALYAHGEPRPQPQPQEGVSYAHKIDKAEARIDWRQPAILLERRMRAFDPAPGLGAQLDGAPIKLWRANVEEHDTRTDPHPPGSVLGADEHGIVVQCGAGRLRITELQRAGARRMRAAEFLRGAALAPGSRLA